MSSPTRRGWGACGGGLVTLVALAILLPARQAPVSAQAPGNNELRDGLQFVPADAAFFLHADASRIWNSAILKDIRKTDAETLGFLTAEAKKELGLAPEDVKTVTLFMPKFRGPLDDDSLGLVLTLNKAFDKEQLTKGVEKLLPKGAKPRVVAVDARTVLVLLNLKEESARPQPAGNTGPLTDALKAAASGKHAVVVGMTLASWPAELRGDDIPPPLRAFAPLFKSLTITGTLGLDKNVTLNLQVKTATAGQAVDCEKALGALLGLIQDELAKGLKELEPAVAKDAGLKDLGTLLKAGSAAAKGAKFSTLGNETELTLSMPGDLPFGGAFVAARKKILGASVGQTSANNLKQIAIAMHSYADTNNSTMPPAAVCDKTGKPQLSWRVLILPYIEQEALYKKFKLDEPWDSEHNKKLIAEMPKVYAIPGQGKPGETHYRVFVGNGAGFDWIRGGRFPADFQDGTSNTLMCVTAADAVPWTKPDELEFDPKKDMSKHFGMVVNGKCHVALFDGSVRMIGKLPGKETLNALITRGGGEVIGDDF